MKTTKTVLVSGALGVLFAAVMFLSSCTSHTPKVAPLSFDIPVSYKSDTAVWRFIKNQEVVWNNFAKEVDKLYRKGEKFRKKEFYALSQSEMIKLLELDNEYASLWVVQVIYLRQMELEARRALSFATEQGEAKIIEAQRRTLEYYRNLASVYGQDLKLDKEALSTLSPEDSLRNALRDSLMRETPEGIVMQSTIDSILRLMTPPPKEEE